MSQFPGELPHYATNCKILLWLWRQLVFSFQIDMQTKLKVDIVDIRLVFIKDFKMALVSLSQNHNNNKPYSKMSWHREEAFETNFDEAGQNRTDRYKSFNHSRPSRICCCDFWRNAQKA